MNRQRHSGAVVSGRARLVSVDGDSYEGRMPRIAAEKENAPGHGTLAGCFKKETPGVEHLLAASK